MSGDGVDQRRGHFDRPQVGEQAEALAKASRPCSGRTFAFGSSHFGPPTAPKQTASARSAIASVSGGRRRAVGVGSAAPPIGNSGQVEAMGEARLDRAQHLDRFGHRLGPDAVAGGRGSPSPPRGLSIVAATAQARQQVRPWPTGRHGLCGPYER